MGLIAERIEESIEVKRKILNDSDLLNRIQMAADMLKTTLCTGGKLLFCGNGGSASDALHMASEFIGRFQKERMPLPAISLNADVAVLTSIANDYGYDQVFSKAVAGLMKPEDVLVGISTSGISENVYQAIQEANRLGGKTIALLGRNGGKIDEIANVSIIVPSECTARIQEAHIMIGHILCESVEEQV